MSSRRFTKKQLEHWLAQFDQSNLSAAAFCREHQLGYQGFLNWRRKARPVEAKTPTDFIEVDVPAPQTGQAISYTLNQWEEILTYIDHGQVEIDNNGVERDVRPVAIGRKNSLFVGSPEAGDRSAVLYSLLISDRHHGVDPEAYLRDVIEKLPGCRNKEAALRKLLPESWAAEYKNHQKALTNQYQAAA